MFVSVTMTDPGCGCVFVFVSVMMTDSGCG